jgi:hypothetical protein
MTVTTDKPVTANGRDPGHCSVVRWCEQEPDHDGDHVREIDSLALHGRRGPVILAVRQAGPTTARRRTRRVEFQIDGEIIALPDTAVRTLRRALRDAAGDSTDDDL